jgi:hypothetical protein
MASEQCPSCAKVSACSAAPDGEAAGLVVFACVQEDTGTFSTSNKTSTGAERAIRRIIERNPGENRAQCSLAMVGPKKKWQALTAPAIPVNVAR